MYFSNLGKQCEENCPFYFSLSYFVNRFWGYRLWRKRVRFETNQKIGVMSKTNIAKTAHAKHK